MRTVITNFDCVTAYGAGVRPLWDGLTRGVTALSPPPAEFSHLTTGAVGLVPGEYLGEAPSRLMRLIMTLAARRQIIPPEDAAVMVASTVGEIDYLETALMTGTGRPEQSRLADLPDKIAARFHMTRPGILVSSACASSTVALNRADALIRAGRESAVLIVGADAVSEFILAGFASLMALDLDRARPFDHNRSGLSAGEAAVGVLLMSEERAEKEGRQPLARILGGGMSCDANHMTGPSRDGVGLARAVTAAIHHVDADSVGLIAAHGTGTLYNDAMEMKALKRVFTCPRPAFSVKGGTGHTMGGAGLVQTIAAVEALFARSAPPTVGLHQVCEEADGWAGPAPRAVEGDRALIVNAGFGGVNAATLLEVIR
ncbi:MAG: beta-ketoacyl synthase N-terminal-like domain-containing protein [Lentisphaeria bacterium]|nr:beta-ketoacyl synthase N-terminal-like domain-containing protein [Lentisphaeria bacterium]